MSVICYPSDILRHKTPPIERFDGELREVARRMFAIMYEANGVGLAGPQAGVPLRICTINCTGTPEGEMVLVNPEIIEQDGRQDGDEGCLSFPGIFISVPRAARVVVRYQDLDGVEQTIEGEGLMARALQHEIDHLNGVLLIDKMSTVQRLAHRRALKMLELRGDQSSQNLLARHAPSPDSEAKEPPTL